MAVRFNPKRLFRFSIGMMLFAMLCVSGYFGSHRSGQTAGVKDRYDQSHFIKTHNVADLVSLQPTADDREKSYGRIIDYLQSTVAPESWSATEPDGEFCEIQPFPTAGSLVISQYGAVHDQIEVALRAFRDHQMKSQDDAAAAEIERLAADEQTEPVVLSKFSSGEPLAMSAVEQRYDGTVRNLTERWGDPRFNGECTDAGFPNWSVAQSIATWPKNGGDAYLAVQDWPDMGRVLLTGWRPRE